MKNILIIGATSAIAEQTARIFSQQGHRLYLVARDATRLATITGDLKLRGADQVDSATLDVNNFSEHAPVLNQAFDKLGQVDIVLIAYGTLPDQGECEKEVDVAVREFNTNAVSTIALLTEIANRLVEQKQGTIAVISSVAGDRGRKSNYLYGSAKAAVTAFSGGLRNRLSDTGVHVVTIKPGMVDTPMTAHMEKGGPLWAESTTIAQGIVKAIEKKSDVVYLPAMWRLIMLIIRSIPERIFKKLNL